MSIALITLTNSPLIRRTMTKCIISTMTRLVAILRASDSMRTLQTILNLTVMLKFKTTWRTLIDLVS